MNNSIKWRLGRELLEMDLPENYEDGLVVLAALRKFNSNTECCVCNVYHPKTSREPIADGCPELEDVEFWMPISEVIATLPVDTKGP